MVNKKKPVQYSCEEEAEFRRALDAIPPPPPPDGSWGWVVVLGAFLCSAIVDGVCFSFGVLLHELRVTFDEGVARTALVGSLLLGCCLLSGPLTSALANRYGCRRVTIAGAIVAAVAFIGSSTSPTLTALSLTYGVMGGFGFGFMYLPSIVCVGLYFEKRRALAAAAAVCGSGVGTLLFAPLTGWLLRAYDWRGVLVFASGIALNGVVAGSVFRPLDDDLRRRRKVILRKLEADKRIGPRTCFIMQRLLEEKRRQRNMSTGSLNNVVITRDNRLLRGEELAAAIAAAQQRQQGGLLSRLRSSFGRSSGSLASGSRSPRASGGRSPRGLSAAGTPRGLSAAVTPLASRRAYVPPPPSALAAGLRQTYSVGSKLSEQQTAGVVSGTAAPTPAVATIFERRVGSIRSLAARPLPRNASSKSLTVFLRPQPAGSGGGLQQLTPTVVVTEPGGDICAAPEQAGWRAADGFSNGVGSPDFLTSRHSMTQLKRMLQQQDAPMYRQDILYSGSVVNLPQYKSTPDVEAYLRSITNVPAPAGSCALETEADSEPWIWRQLSFVPRAVKDVINTTLDLRSLRSPTFLLFSFSSMLTMMGFFAPFAFLLEAALEAGVDEEIAPYLLSVLGVANTVGRIAAGALANHAWLDCLVVNDVALVIAGGMTLLVPLCTSFTLFAVYAAVYGLCIAIFVSLRSVIVVELMGLEKLTTAFGQLILIQGLAVIAGTPLAGHLRDATGSYRASFYAAGSAIALSGLLCLPLRRLADWERHRGDSLSQERLRTESVSAESEKAATASNRSVSRSDVLVA